MPRRLFCELCPLAYKISVLKCTLARKIDDLFSKESFAKEKGEKLSHVIYAHNSLIRRRLGNVDTQLQENKANNLALAAPKINSIIIKPGEVFSFWRLCGSVTKRKGYKYGLTIKRGQPDKDIGGGMCQMTNLLHWLFIHSSLQITEHHHHDGVDLFPDHNRQVPFGTGTSIMYNYLDYRVKNTTQTTYQLCVWVDGEYLKSELRANAPQTEKYHIVCENEAFVREGDSVYRIGEVYRKQIDTKTGSCTAKLLLRKNHAKVMYDTSGLAICDGADN